MPYLCVEKQKFLDRKVRLNTVSLKNTMSNLRDKVYAVFSDTLMIALALLVIPVLALQNFVSLTSAQNIMVSVVDWIIWIAFFLEFVLKLVVSEKKIRWLRENTLDSVVSVIVILSPLLEHSFTSFAAAPALRLLRLSRFARFARLLRVIRLVALGAKVKHSWKRINLKVYAAFFFIVGVGFTASFITTGLSYTDIDTTWISLFVSTFGVFYSFLISFFVVQVWGKFGSMENEVGKQVNALRNVYLLAVQMVQKPVITGLMVDYINEIIRRFWQAKENEPDVRRIDETYLKILSYFGNVKVQREVDSVMLDNIIEELRSSSVAQSNLATLAASRTPKILWILLIFLSTILVGSFIFLGFENRLLATVLISIVSAVTGLIVALIFDIDSPFASGFWNITPDPYVKLKELILKAH